MKLKINFFKCAAGLQNSISFVSQQTMIDLAFLEQKILSSKWWDLAMVTPDSHYSNKSGVMLSHHLEAVYENIEHIFAKRNIGFYARLFNLLPKLDIKKDEIREDLLLVALLHDIGKPREDKSHVIAHPLTGKPAHKRHGLVALIAAIEILGPFLSHSPERKNRIFRTIELHDISYGLFREYMITGFFPQDEKWNAINDKIHSLNGAGIFYLLLFKLADVHGHANISDVTWFYNAVKQYYLKELKLELPVPVEADIRAV